MIHPDGYWVPDLAPKQLEVFNNKSVYQLVSGPVLSGKSFAVEHKVVRHLWDTPGARFAAFSKTIKAARHGGSYEDLIGIIIPQWLKAGLVGIRPDIKFEYTMEPKVDGQTRTSTFRIRNRYGGESEFLLFSLDHDEAIEGKIKQTRFSGFWFIEVTNFGDDDGSYKIWRITSSRMRMVHLKDPDHLWICDCNPSEEGEESWLYKLFYLKQGFSSPDDDWMIKNLSVTEFTIPDNPWLDADRIAKIKSENRSDPALYARNVEGKWVARQTGGHFTDVFFPNVHIRGDVSSPKKEDWKIIIPDAGCVEFCAGWDPGDIHSSFHIATKRPVGDNDYSYSYIDELSNLGKMVSLQDFTDTVMEKIQFWEQVMLEEYGIKQLLWHHWADSSTYNLKASLDGTEARLINIYSEDKIRLTAVDKPKGSKKKRVEAWRRLLFTNRLFISAQLKNTIQMCRSLKRGSSEAEFISDAGGWRHIFDSASYILSGEEPIETLTRMPSYGKRRSGTYVGMAA